MNIVPGCYGTHVYGTPDTVPYPTYRKDTIGPQPSGKVHKLLWVREDSVLLMYAMRAKRDRGHPVICFHAPITEVPQKLFSTTW